MNTEDVKKHCKSQIAFVEGILAKGGLSPDAVSAWKGQQVAFREVLLFIISKE